MSNTTFLLGHIYSIEDISDGIEVILKVPRISEENPIYDYILVVMNKNISDIVKERCSKDDVIAVNGRLECDLENSMRVIAEKITLLSGKEDEDDKKEE